MTKEEILSAARARILADVAENERIVDNDDEADIAAAEARGYAKGRADAKAALLSWAEWMRNENRRGGSIPAEHISQAEWAALKASGER